VETARLSVRALSKQFPYGIEFIAVHCPLMRLSPPKKWGRFILYPVKVVVRMGSFDLFDLLSQSG